MTYCINRQDQFILDFFGEHTGSCLEIGANDGHYESQTLALIEKGWTATLVEPLSVHCETMRRNHINWGSDARVSIIEAAILPYDHPYDRVTLYDCVDHAHSAPTGCMSIDQRWITWQAAKLGHPGDLYPHDVPALSINNLMAMIGYNFDFVVIDAEGVSIDIALAMPWSQMPTKLISVEADEHRIAEFERIGWKHQRTITWDILFSR